VSFHIRHCMLLCQQTHKTHSDYHLVAVELPFIPKVINCMHQTTKTYTEREHSTLLSVTARSMFRKSVTVLVAV